MNSERWNRFLELGIKRKILYLEALVWLFVWHFAIKVLKVDSFRWYVGRKTESKVRSNEEAAPEIAQRIGHAITNLAHFLPWKPMCLAQALSAITMLKVRRVGYVVHFGANSNSRENGTIELHCWVVAGKRIITGQKGHESFKIIRTLYH